MMVVLVTLFTWAHLFKCFLKPTLHSLAARILCCMRLVVIEIGYYLLLTAWLVHSIELLLADIHGIILEAIAFPEIGLAPLSMSRLLLLVVELLFLGDQVDWRHHALRIVL